MIVDGTRQSDRAIELVLAYYAAFNRGDTAAMLDLLADDIAHDINQGKRETGKQAFTAFLARMDRCYREQLRDIVVMANESGDRAAAEYVVHGEYLADDEGLPPASGQKYVLPGGAFFDVRDGLIARVSNYYNLEDWVAQVSK
ncbi:MAG: ketosteroid isomerase-related protein [Pseudomonadota bacterium]